ncbi:MAG TPA: glycosyltransferase [Candidatus Dojkabacteria bacterium]|nr:glycosyltransferase [Candidatus Dojkabacteria bacterium]
MVSVIIVSFKEPKTIGRCISSVANKKYSGIKSPFEIIQVSPDTLTLRAGKKEANKLKLSKKQFIQIKDPKKGKPYALRMALKKAKGDIVILTDGDTYFERNAVKKLLEPFENDSIGGVSGRPMSGDPIIDKYSYWGHLLSDSAHHRRTKLMNKVEGKDYYVSKDTFFPMSGYIMAMRNYDIKIPRDVLSDDAYISYAIRNIGKEIGYAPEAVCYVKYPTNFKDYLKQKARSLGGFSQLKRIGVFKRDKQSRSFFIELKYTFFVLRYAKSIKQFWWSLQLFPMRLITWIVIWWQQKILRKGMPKGGWERIESTK